MREPTGTLGKRIRQRRLEKNWSQTTLGEECGCGCTEISQYEIGTIEPRAFKLYALTRALECSADWLLGLSEVKERR